MKNCPATLYSLLGYNHKFLSSDDDNLVTESSFLRKTSIGLNGVNRIQVSPHHRRYLFPENSNRALYGVLLLYYQI